MDARATIAANPFFAEVLGETARLGIDLGSGEALERYERWRRFDTFMSAAARIFSTT